MAIHRGIQSAIFFYLSCAPCAEARYRKKRKQEAVWNRAERDALEEEMPDMYRHPEPSSTNPYWQSEIALGPALVSRGGGNRNKGKNNHNGGGGGGKTSREMLSCNGSMVEATSTLDLNSLQQREDERLWGSTDMMDGPGSTVQRPQRVARRRGMSNETSTTVGTTSTAAAYSSFRSPPVSELLPPIVRTVHSREEVAWMMQPPPVADIMSGKREGGARSGASSRQGSAKMARTVSRGSSRTASSALHGMTESPKTLPADYRRPTSRSGEALEIIPAPMRRVASRPPLLSTIASEGNVQEEARLALVDSAKSQPTKYRPRNRARSTSDPKKGRVLKGRIFTTAVDPPSKDPASPEVAFGEGGEVREELFDSWYTPDFELGRWVHEHTRREGIRERWSFDV